MIKSKTYKFIVLIAIIGLFAINGCKNNEQDKEEKIEKPSIYKSNFNLKLSGSCEETGKFLKDTAKSNIKRFFMEFNTGGYPIYVNDDINYEAESGGSHHLDGLPEHSETNVQEKGVDEADIVKNDGNYIYILNDEYFLIFKSWPADELAELSRITLEGHPFDLFISDNRVIIFTNIYYWDNPELFNNSASGSILKISIYNVTDRTNPAAEREIYIEGDYMTSRRIGSKVYAVTSYYMNKFSPYNLFNLQEFADLGYDNPFLEAAMLNYVDNADIGEFLPGISDKIYSGGGAVQDQITFFRSTSLILPLT
jgi:uncharacterized secreted protein with C-terminal beta-propeller domain